MNPNDVDQMLEWIQSAIKFGIISKISITLEPLKEGKSKDVKIQFEQERPSHELEDK
tara:strand:+ start:1422 stop:1592 length:171 start_codon:yes stop_codon:yes gene_type:complete